MGVCGGCYFAKRTEIINEDKEQFLCLYNPPSSMAIPEPGLMGKTNLKFVSIYPIVNKKDFCHGWREA